MASSHVHHYELTLSWAADASSRTANYRSYNRDHLIEIDGKAPMQVSADPAFLGNSSPWPGVESAFPAVWSRPMKRYPFFALAAALLLTVLTS